MRIFRHPVHLCLVLLYVLTLIFWAAGPVSRAGVAETGRVVFGLIGFVAAVRAARDGGPERRSWRAFAVAFALLALSPPVLMVLHAHGFTAGDDVTHVAFVVALQLFPLAATDRRDRWRTALDALIVLVGGTMLILTAAVQEGSFYPWGGLAIGGAVLSGVVLWRQILVQRESDEQAVTDGLTGLANRARFRATSHRALARGARTGRYSAVLVMDVNGVKQVNDTLGHQLGDLVLVEFARMLRLSVGSPGLSARLGGDEFAVVLPDLGSPEQAYEVAGRIAASLAPVIVDGRLIVMAASIGVAVSAPGELTHDVLVHRADLAMYRAKEYSPETRWTAWRESYENEPGAGRLAAAA